MDRSGLGLWVDRRLLWKPSPTLIPSAVSPAVGVAKAICGLAREDLPVQEPSVRLQGQSSRVSEG
jgi:hypothetical protein